jgi:hypothetical protein
MMLPIQDDTYVEQEPEHDAEEERRDRRPGRHGEDRPVDPELAWARVASELGEHDHDDDHDQQHRDPLGRQQHPGAAASRRDGQPPDQQQAGRAKQEAGPGRLVRPDPDRVEEAGREPAARHRGGDRVERVRPGQRPGGDHAGRRPEGGADEPVNRARVVEALGQPHERVGHEQDADEGQRERQRDGAADGPGRALRVDARRHRRRHQRQ